MADLNRREFIAATAAGAAWLMLGGCQSRGEGGSASGGAPMIQNPHAPGQPMEHPFLFFAATDVPRMRAAAHSTHEKYFADLTTWCRQFAGQEPLAADQLPANRDVEQVYFENAAACAINFALLWTITGEALDQKAALKWFTAFCSYPVDINGGYFVGSYALALAAGYDMLYPVLDESARSRGRSHLAAVLDRGAKGTAIDWWAGLLVHHDHFLPAAGLCVGAAAVAGETPGGMERLAFLSQHFDKTMNAIGDDGAWTEGAALWAYAMAMGYIWFDVCKRATGRDLFQTPMVRGNVAYRLYNWLGNDLYVFHHDSSINGRYNIMGSASCHLMRKLAGELKNGQAQWLADHDEPGDLSFLTRKLSPKPNWMTDRNAIIPATHCVAWNFLWYDPTVAPQGPAGLPKHHYFPNQGLVIARSGWGLQDTVMTFTCAPYGGHQARALVLAGDQKLASNMGHIHTAAGSFNLFAGGTGLVVGPGYGGTASSSEDTLTIEGADQQPNPRCDANLRRIEMADDHVYLAGDATACYPPQSGLANWTRQLVWLAPGVLIIADDLTAAAPMQHGKQTVWRMDFDNDNNLATISQKDQAFHIGPQTDNKPMPALIGRLLQPHGMQLTSADVRMPKATWSMCGQMQASVTDIFRESANARILAALQAVEHGLIEPGNIAAIDGEGLMGAAVSQPGGCRAAVFVTPYGVANPWPVHFTLPGQREIRCLISGLPPDTPCSAQVRRQSISDGAANCTIILSQGGGLKTSAAGTLLVKDTAPGG